MAQGQESQTTLISQRQVCWFSTPAYCLWHPSINKRLWLPTSVFVTHIIFISEQHFCNAQPSRNRDTIELCRRRGSFLFPLDLLVCTSWCTCSIFDFTLSLILYHCIESVYPPFDPGDEQLLNTCLKSRMDFSSAIISLHLSASLCVLLPTLLLSTRPLSWKRTAVHLMQQWWPRLQSC